MSNGEVLRQKPAAPRRDRHRFKPLFVLAPARSYTSVVATMIGQHPDLAGLPELKLFAYHTIDELEASLPPYWMERGFTHRSPGLVRAVAQFEFGDQAAQSLAAARAWLRERGHWSGADVFDVLLGQLAPRTAVEKSPESVAATAALRRLSFAYPEARYLHLTRHPVTTAASAAEHLLRTVPEYPRLGEPTAGIAAWHDVHARILRFTANLPVDRVLRVRAEDVLNDMLTQLRVIAEWLQLRTDAAAIEAMCHPEVSPFACPGPAGSGVLGGHDHAFLRDPIPRRVELPSTVEPPAGWHGERHLWRRITRLAYQLGYGQAQGRPRRTRQRSAAIDLSALRRELLRRRDLDRALRSSYTGAATEMARLMEMDSDNTAWLVAIVERIGWPGYSLVGEDGAEAAWLLAQHADLNPAFQQRCLQILKEAAERGDASPAAVAGLTDRVQSANDQPQLPLARRECPGCGEIIDVRLPTLGGIARFKCPICGATGTIRARLRATMPPA
jgi:hypothetical protein